MTPPRFLITHFVDLASFRTKEDLLAMDMSFYPISRTQRGPKTISGPFDSPPPFTVLTSIFEEERVSLSTAAPTPTIHRIFQSNAGVTNYYLPVWRTANGSLSLDEAAGGGGRGGDGGAGSASAPSWIVFFFDSGGGNEQPGYVMPSQVAWFNETAAGLAARWGKVPIVAFMHIPLPEFMDLWNNGTVYGWNNDSIACQDVNSGLFDAFAANGNVRLVVSGHNHQNNFCGTWRNVSLCYGQHSGYGGYGINGATITGSRVIELYDGPVPVGRRPWEARRDGGAARILRIDGADQDPFAVGGATWGFATYIRHQDGTILPRGPTHPPCADNSGGVDGCVQTKCTDPLGP